MDEMNDRWLSVDEICKYLGIRGYPLKAGQPLKLRGLVTTWAPVTVGGPMGSGLCYCTFDKTLYLKKNTNKSVNNASLTPTPKWPML